MKKNNVKRLRRSRGLSQTDMAKMLNIPSTRISAWELGKSAISEEAEMLADFFDVSTAYVTGDSMDKWEQYDIFCSFDDEKNLDEYRAKDYQEMELLECYRFMESSGKSYLMQTVKMLKKFYGMEN